MRYFTVLGFITNSQMIMFVFQKVDKDLQWESVSGAFVAKTKAVAALGDLTEVAE